MQLPVFVEVEVEGADDLLGYVFDLALQEVSGVGEVQEDGAFVGGASFAAEVAGGFEAFEQR
ncbi:hypothetical protein [Paractinoplanes durhamensis]|uniref:hypothetical protein n=1 Tax=Paractinoplanes durhamensis TaxID=113563 RepID=UPI00363E1059